jgi:Tyrosine phosphatase family
MTKKGCPKLKIRPQTEMIADPAAGTLPLLPPGQSLGIALGIPTVPNLRDVGGYKTRGGAIVACGLAYRSDTFNPMTAEDIGKLGRVGLKND